jgi:hypothetical protein
VGVWVVYNKIGEWRATDNKSKNIFARISFSGNTTQSSSWISARTSKAVSTSTPGLCRNCKRYHSFNTQIVQKFIASNSKTLQLSPFQYAAGQTAVQPLENFDWDSAFNAHKEEPASNLNLNLVDLDFL